MAAPAFPLSEDETADFLRAALAEDIGSGDITSMAVIPEAATFKAAMVAREPMTIAGLGLAARLFRMVESRLRILDNLEDGTRVPADTRLMTVAGPARGLLTAERTALNLVQHLSGIATLSARYVDAVAGTGAIILDTRKTIPLLRRIQKYATRCGGAQNHRMGLYDGVMIKDNHIAAAGSITAAVAAARAAGLRDIEVECDSLAQVRLALEAGAERILLDNMPPSMLREAVAIVAGRVPLEASGGVRLETVREIAETGVDYISIGRLTQSAPAIDIGLDYAG
ncbi:MAG: carboxylating nicotinate-nucleotide diphosphorylase [Rhodothalassiaceae bacterium]